LQRALTLPRAAIIAGMPQRLPPPRIAPRRTAPPTVLAAALPAFAALALAGCFEVAPPAAPAEDGAPATVVARGDLAADEQATIELFRAASPSVGFVTSVTLGRDWNLDLFEMPRGTGSCFVWDDRGHVVTNFHVVQGSNAARVTLADQSEWPAELVGAAPEKDLAVLRIEAPAERLHPLPLGGSEGLLVGQKVLAIGNPFGLDQTLTTGVISALGREIPGVGGLPIRDMVQTDAAVNPGNSGGPLLDSAGRLIGVNTAIYSPSGAYAGIGFAIPVDTVAWVVPELIANGRLVRPTLGVELAPAALAAQAGVEGALVIQVVAGSGADRAGLRPTRRGRFGGIELGDVIVGVDGEPVETAADLVLLLERRQPGETVEVTVERGGRRRAVEVELGTAR
jgi:S1-C subfamily serine protease